MGCRNLELVDVRNLDDKLKNAHGAELSQCPYERRNTSSSGNAGRPTFRPSNSPQQPADISGALYSYILSQEQMVMMGYPIESPIDPSSATIFKNPMPVPIHTNDVHRPTQTSSNNAPRILTGSVISRTCARCSNLFYMNSNDTYATKETCCYHWGKLRYAQSESVYSCCGGPVGSNGCTSAKVHVWTGLETGFNGPLPRYVHTKRRTSPRAADDQGVYAIDGEMCFTGRGLELTKISVIGLDGRVVYSTFVKPKLRIVDFNTRFSGITGKDMSRRNHNLKTLTQVKTDLLEFIFKDTVLIGHGLDNEMRALRILHPTIIDTAHVFPHYSGFPYRRPLRSLASTFLRRDIQTGSHDSVEDARACMDLMLWRVGKDFGNILDHSHY